MIKVNAEPARSWGGFNADYMNSASETEEITLSSPPWLCRVELRLTSDWTSGWGILVAGETLSKSHE